MAKKALLVGINDYKSVSDLRGCVNDVTNMRSILKNYFGFSNRNVRVLLDSRATKQGILDRLQWLTSGAKAGDFLFFHFSGHGSQIRDRGPKDELSDNMDELICPYDMDWNGTFITDDDLNAIFSKLPKGLLLEVVLDSCHSGTGLRDINLGRPPELGPPTETLPRFLPPPLDIVCRYEGEEDELKPMKRLMREREAVHHILWSGCKDNQTSADAYIAGSYNGAFTYYFCKHIRDSNNSLIRSELLKRIRDSLSHNGYSQTPQLECEATVRTGRALTTKGK